MKKIFICTGDSSGDMHAAKLMNAIRKQLPDIQFVGIGGTEMTKAGLNSIIPISEISVVGFWEVAKKYPLFRKLMNDCISIMHGGDIDAFVPVDYPGFNLRLAAIAKEAQIPVIYYIAPQLWAWGANRAEKLARSVDKLLVVFPFEEDYFKNYGINTKFVGHPLLDIPEYTSNFNNYSDREDKIVLLAGSRNQEIHKHLPLLINTAEFIHNKLPNFELVFAKSKSINQNLFNSALQTHKYISISDDAKTLMLNSKAGIIKTGTSNLEAALSGLPFAMYYITSFISFQMGKRLINLDYISLVNILAKKFVVKEFIQSEAKPELIGQNIINIVQSPDLYSQLQSEFLTIKNELGGGGAAQNAAAEILNSI